MPDDLVGLQNWLMDVVTTPGGVLEGIRLARERHAIDANQAVRGSNRLSSAERLNIYARGYVLRLLECLRAEFPVLSALVGPQVFEMFASAYIWSRPPRTTSLYDVGAGFAAFLRETRPADAADGSIEAVPSQLALLERARAEAHRARGVEREPAHAALDAFTLTALGARLAAPDSLRLLRLEFDFLPALAQVARGERPDAPPARGNLYAVARSRYRVQVHALEPWQFAFLEACAAAPCLAIENCDATARAIEGNPARVRADLLLWMPVALEAAMLTLADDDAPSHREEAATAARCACSGPVLERPAPSVQ
jgi:Putative DNA-binding domain